MRKPAVHVIGAGLAGLAAAVRLADGSREIILHEAARQAGGRCRSYHDAQLGMAIDNGNHLLLSGNHAARNFLATIGSEDELQGPAEADFPFFDLASKKRWRVRPNAGPMPWWIFSAERRAPDTGWRDYLALLRLLVPGKDRPIAAAMRCDGPLYERLWRPFLLAALNAEPKEGSARLAGAVVRETLAKGGRACRPLVAAHGLSAAFIDPALRYLSERGAQICLDHRLRKIDFAAGRVSALDFGDATQPLGPADQVVLAVPPLVARDLMPGLQTPESFRAIVNAHFRIAPPKDCPAILGVINATTEWLFAFPDRLSVTISGADRLLDAPREELAQKIWAEVAEAARIEKPLPPWQIIKEKRATFAATCEENARRPGAATAYPNLFLAGDWTATGLPATIEGAIRSGNRAADLVRRSQ
ncbi:hydroxysqualene dehydroxylase HpnE [Methylocapsa polymorpha]|uniref:Hydroxysqualene dehydroxylase HpnE n=1 Tax=Methylocapsa polymorpha TaxID=3080828 RepID=A0ABZ0HXK3_9HYPH|nr:hydroxysqualene dehydroxylase HpnE [Methylocapsa sp. RX1]